MSNQPKKAPCSIALLAHVDAGKTTLSEALLYASGTRRTLGRVDHADAFLDTHALERARGITIFSKQARLETPHRVITLVDTPGHVDFSAEAERVMPVLDCAVLVISGTDGVQAHTQTLWRLLERYGVPTGKSFLLSFRSSSVPAVWILTFPGKKLRKTPLSATKLYWKPIWKPAPSPPVISRALSVAGRFSPAASVPP